MCTPKGKSPGRPFVSDVTADRVPVCFQRSLQKSRRLACCELRIPQTSRKILRKLLLTKLHKLRLVQALKPEDLAVQHEFCSDIPARIENHNDLPARFIFSDEATFTSKIKWTGIVSVFGERKAACYPRALKSFTKSECVLCHFKEDRLWPLLISWKTPSGVICTWMCFLHGFCPNWKRILTTSLPNTWGATSLSLGCCELLKRSPTPRKDRW
jgi:hypothetical protein